VHFLPFTLFFCPDTAALFFTLCGASLDIFHSFLYWLDFILPFMHSNPFFSNQNQTLS